MRRLAAPLALLLASTACTTMEAAPPATSALQPERMISPIGVLPS